MLEFWVKLDNFCDTVRVSAASGFGAWFFATSKNLTKLARYFSSLFAPSITLQFLGQQIGFLPQYSIYCNKLRRCKNSKEAAKRMEVGASLRR
jgi:hypothetical protein